MVFLVDDGRRSAVSRWVYKRLSGLSVRMDGRFGWRLLRRIESLPGRRQRTISVDGVAHRVTPIPANALAQAMSEFAPEVVVGSSLDRWAWRRIHEVCDRHGVPSVLYVREDDSLSHMATGAVPAAVVANAESLAEALRSQGFECDYVPSVVNLDVTRVETSRRVALAINPIESRGVDLVWNVAERLPTVRFVVQESWPLTAEQLSNLNDHLRLLPNVEFRRATAPGPHLYGDARVSLVPYRVDNRPRVIAEAFANGIPAIVADLPALVDACGAGGVRVPIDGVDQWCAAIERLWSDDDAYNALVEAARSHSLAQDDELVRTVAKFESILDRGRTSRNDVAVRQHRPGPM